MPRNRSYDLHPEAQLEIEGAYRWYSERSADVAIGFISSISGALEIVAQNPHRWPCTAPVAIFLAPSRFQLFILTIRVG